MSAAIRICPLAVTAMERRSSRKVSGFPVRSTAGFAPNAESALKNCQVQASRTPPISAILVRSSNQAGKGVMAGPSSCWQGMDDGFTNQHLQRHDLLNAATPLGLGAY
jgi:hypothetical protein